MKEKTSFLPELETAAGRVDYLLTNDYIFRAVCQRNNRALKGLISSLMHIPVEDIHSVAIMNPIAIGETYTDKEFHMDVRVKLNGNMAINIEMQVRSQCDWPERAASYLCRMFDNLSKGDSYADVMPAVHIGILDFTPFPDRPAFYSCNKLMDEKSYHIFSDKLALNVLDLSKEAMATDEDREWMIDKWARLFKAETWEEVRMIAAENEYLMEASNTLYTLNSDFEIRERARNRAEYYRSLKRMEDALRENKEIKEKAKEIEERVREAEKKLKENEERARESEEKARESEEKARESEEKARESEEKAKESEEKAKESEERAKEAEEKVKKGIIKTIALCRKNSMGDLEIKQLLMEDFDMSAEEASMYMDSQANEYQGV